MIYFDSIYRHIRTIKYKKSIIKTSSVEKNKTLHVYFLMFMFKKLYILITNYFHDRNYYN